MGSTFDPSDIGGDPMEDYVVRIYRLNKDNPRAIVGLVETVGKKGKNRVYLDG